jgi:hypothetical protein
MELSELNGLKREAIVEIAKRLKVPNKAFLDNDEIRDFVKGRSPEVSVLFERFVSAFEEGGYFHLRIEAQRKEGKLNEDESRQLVTLVERKNAARDALVKGLPQEKLD